GYPKTAPLFFLKSYYSAYYPSQQNRHRRLAIRGSAATDRHVAELDGQLAPRLPLPGAGPLQDFGPGPALAQGAEKKDRKFVIQK
ncbi:MAG: hypothetical protein IKZ91_03485, partial [Bacteroidales bacterium]|nr:hypothetical protein [Bacteroidales bacterium]